MLARKQTAWPALLLANVLCAGYTRKHVHRLRQLMEWLLGFVAAPIIETKPTQTIKLYKHRVWHCAFWRDFGWRRLPPANTRSNQPNSCGVATNTCTLISNFWSRRDVTTLNAIAQHKSVTTAAIESGRTRTCNTAHRVTTTTINQWQPTAIPESSAEPKFCA